MKTATKEKSKNENFAKGKRIMVRIAPIRVKLHKYSKYISVLIILFLLYCGKKKPHKDQTGDTIGAELLPTTDLLTPIPLISPTPKTAETPDPDPTESLCDVPETVTGIPPYLENRNQSFKKVTFESLKSKVTENCASCHGAPKSGLGGFRFSDSLEDAEMYVDGVKQIVPGIKSAAKRMIAAMDPQRTSSDPTGVKKTMPPNRYEQNPQYFEELRNELRYWNANGSSPDYVLIPQKSDLKGHIPYINATKFTTDLGDCLPKDSQTGHDPQKDENFENLSTLPELLSQTDLTSYDSLELAKKGTFSYNVEYPLWADNAEKGRFIHLPSEKTADGKFQRVAAQYNKETQQFDIPKNTRFYKTFYKAVKGKDGEVRFRKIETRLIVVKDSLNQNLVGTYKWNETESEATLQKTPYRDGTGWQDDSFEITTDVVANKKRLYAIPGSQRCADCHNGSASGILGFSGLQLNRRAFGEGARDFETKPSELKQIDRLITYGVLSGIAAKSDLPLLEKTGVEPRNEHELRLQGYLVGNCAHCHNKDGLAFKDGVSDLDLSAGKLFNFATNRVSKVAKASVSDSKGKPFLVKGKPSDSYFYARLSARDFSDADEIPMPMHTPGGANCRLVNLANRWILSVDPTKTDIGNQIVPCETPDEFFWINTDITNSTGAYIPRRPDWRDSSKGMPQKFKNYWLSETLLAMINKSYPNGFYREKTSDGSANCSFPTVPAPSELPIWAQTDPGATKPKPPWGQVYWTTPGAMFYSEACEKCHGMQGDGKSTLATKLALRTGGSKRVPSFVDCLFGADGNNLKQFEKSIEIMPDDRNVYPTNLAGNYLIWMAMEGTLFTFPKSFHALIGENKAQMLKTLRDQCISMLPGHPQPKTARAYGFEVYRDICFYNNGSFENPSEDLKFVAPDENSDPVPVNKAAVEAWADKAAANIGWSIFEYIKGPLSISKIPAKANECEKVFPLK